MHSVSSRGPDQSRGLGFLEHPHFDRVVLFLDSAGPRVLDLARVSGEQTVLCSVQELGRGPVLTAVELYDLAQIPEIANLILQPNPVIILLTQIDG
jgi:hypothetical protein